MSPKIYFRIIVSMLFALAAFLSSLVSLAEKEPVDEKRSAQPRFVVTPIVDRKSSPKSQRIRGLKFLPDSVKITRRTVKDKKKKGLLILARYTGAASLLPANSEPAKKINNRLEFFFPIDRWDREITVQATDNRGRVINQRFGISGQILENWRSQPRKYFFASGEFMTGFRSLLSTDNTNSAKARLQGSDLYVQGGIAMPFYGVMHNIHVGVRAITFNEPISTRTFVIPSQIFPRFEYLGMYPYDPVSWFVTGTVLLDAQPFFGSPNSLATVSTDVRLDTLASFGFAIGGGYEVLKTKYFDLISWSDVSLGIPLGSTDFGTSPMVGFSGGAQAFAKFLHPLHIFAGLEGGVGFDKTDRTSQIHPWFRVRAGLRWAWLELDT